RYRSKSSRRSSAMRRASAGRTSARLSGNNQVDIMRFRSIPGKIVHKQKATWGVSPPSRLRRYFNLRRIVPCCGAIPKYGRERRRRRLGSGGRRSLPIAPEREELRIGADHEQVVLAGGRRAVGLEALAEAVAHGHLGVGLGAA